MIVKAISTGARLSPFALLLSPTFWIAFGIWTATVAFYCRDYGAEQERFKQQALTIQALEAQEKAAAKVLATERQLRTDDTREFLKFKENQAHAAQAHSQLLSDLRSDNRRLRIAIRSVRPPAADTGGALGTRDRDEGFADVDPGTAVALVTITDRGDSAIRKHAALVDRYERLRLACTDPSTHPQEESP